MRVFKRDDEHDLRDDVVDALPIGSCVHNTARDYNPDGCGFCPPTSNGDQ